MPLAEHFIKKCNSNKPLSKEAKALLEWYDWPGNVRELENYTEQAVKLSVTPELIPVDFVNINIAYYKKVYSSNSEIYCKESISNFPTPPESKWSDLEISFDEDNKEIVRVTIKGNENLC